MKIDDYRLLTHGQKYVIMYLDWVNNFLTINAFAEYYSITKASACRCVDLGKRFDSQLRCTVK